MEPLAILAAESDALSNLPGGILGFLAGGGGAIFMFRLYDRNRSAELERTLTEKQRYYDDREKSMAVIKSLAESNAALVARADGIEKSIAVLHERMDAMFEELVRLRP